MVSKNNKRKKNNFLKRMQLKAKKRIKQKIKDCFNFTRRLDFKYDPTTSKIFSNVCNLMTLSLVILCSLFVYFEDSIFYSYPIITVLVVFVFAGSGNRYKDNSKRDVSLYKKILLANLFVALFVFCNFYEKLWYINFFMVVIFIVPLYISKYAER